jgi:hypothetical protein
MAFAISKNLKRRHLNESQRATVAAHWKPTGTATIRIPLEASVTADTTSRRAPTLILPAIDDIDPIR